MKFKKALAALLAATMVISGNGFANPVFAAAPTITPDSNGVYTITSDNIRVYEEDVLTYNGTVQKPQIYVDMDGSLTYNSGDYLLTDSDEDTVFNSLVATQKGSNVNASDTASVKLLANTYKDSFKVYDGYYSSETFKIEQDIIVTYTINKLDLTNAKLKINDSNSPTADFVVGGGVNLTLSGTKSTGTDNIVNVYSDGTMLTDVTGLTLTNEGASDATEGKEYKATVKADKDAANFVSEKSKDLSYTALLNVLTDATITFKDVYKKLTYNGNNQILGKNAVSKVTLGTKSLDLDSFFAKVSKFPYAVTLEYEALKTEDEKLAYAKAKGYKDTTSFESDLKLQSTKDAGTYYFILYSNKKYYSGYAETTYTINKLDVSNWSVDAGTAAAAGKVIWDNSDCGALNYTGSEIKPVTKAYIKNSDGIDKTFQVKDGNLSVAYTNNVNAPQAVSDYVKVLTDLGLAKTTNGRVEIYQISGEDYPVGHGTTTVSHSSLPKTITDKYDETAWKNAVKAAQNTYLPKVTLTFNDDNIKGTVTAKNAFKIGQFDLSTAIVTGAEASGDATTTDYTYAISESDPITLGVNGIQVKNADETVTYAANELKSAYAYSEFNSTTAFTNYNYTDASSFGMVGGENDTVQAVKVTISPAANNNNLKNSTTAYIKTGTSLNDTAVNFKLKKNTVVYTGSSVKDTIDPYLETAAQAELDEGEQYTITYYKEDGVTEVDPIDVGTYVVTARGKGGYAGAISKTFTITQKSIDAKTDKVNNDVSMTALTTFKRKKYDGSPTSTAMPITGAKATMSYGDVATMDGFAATVTDSKAGAASALTYGAKNNYTLTFVNDVTGTSYTAENVKELGTYSIILNGVGNYSGTLDSGYDLVVAAQPLSAANITIKSTDGTASNFNTAKDTPVDIYYAGSAITSDMLSISAVAGDGKTALVAGKDYIATITTNASEVNAPSGVVTITTPASSNYSATDINARFNVVKADLSDSKVFDITFENGNDAYYAHGSEPKFTITDKRTNSEIAQKFSSAKVNYTYEYATNIVGKAGGTLTIKVIDNNTSYSGNYTIKTGPLKKDFNTVYSVEKLAYGGIVDYEQFEYDGTDKLPTITIQDDAGKTLEKDKDYTVTVMNAEENKTFDTMTDVLRSNNREAKDLISLNETSQGDYKQYYHVVIKGTGDYIGTKVFRVGVTPLSIKDKTVEYVYDKQQEYTGAYIEPVEVYHTVVGASGNATKVKLTSGKDYTISYQNNKDIGTATFVLKGAGNFDRVYSVYNSDPAQFEIVGTGKNKTYSEDEVKDAIAEATKGMISTASAEALAAEAARAAATAVEDALATASADAAKAKNDAADAIKAKTEAENALATASADAAKAKSDAADAIKAKTEAENALATASADAAQAKAEAEAAKNDKAAAEAKATEAEAKATEAASKLTEAEANASAAQTKLNTSLADLDAAKAAQATAEANLKAAQADLATAQTAQKTAEANLKAAQDAQKAAEAKVKTAEAAQKTAESAQKAAEKKVTAAKAVKKGEIFVSGKNLYKITNVSKKTVEFVGTYSTGKSVTIAATVKYSKNSVTYKVTSIAASAMKSNTTVTKVTIGKNVTTIGKNAFNGCSKLKTLTIKSSKITSVKSGALKIAKKATVKVPSAKVSAYKKLFKNAGLPSTATVKK